MAFVEVQVITPILFSPSRCDRYYINVLSYSKPSVVLPIKVR